MVRAAAREPAAGRRDRQQAADGSVRGTDDNAPSLARPASRRRGHSRAPQRTPAAPQRQRQRHRRTAAPASRPAARPPQRQRSSGARTAIAAAPQERPGAQRQAASRARPRSAPAPASPPAAAGRPRRPLIMPMAVHQVLPRSATATPSGTKCSAFSACCARPATSPRFSSRPPIRALEDLTRRLPRAAGCEPSRQHPDSPLLDRIAGLAHRLRAARSHGARLPQHHAARVLHRRQPVLVQQCFLGGASWRSTATRCDLALGDSEYNRQELEALGFPRTGVLPVVPDFAHLRGPANYMQRRRVRRRLGEPAVCRPRRFRTSGSKT